MNKRGAIWVSAVLYMGLGIMVLSMVLAVGLPTVQKMKDKYTIKETKNLMLILDDNIRTIHQEGPGSQRVIDLNIGRGTFEIDTSGNKISWSFQSKVPASQPGQVSEEGNLDIETIDTAIKEQYGIVLTLNYPLYDITFESEQDTISGRAKLSILNKGSTEGDLVNINLQRI